MRVPYSADIDRSNPTCFVFLIDQSASMQEHYAGAAGQSKSEALAYQINNLLAELIVKCSRPEIRDYFHLAVIGYGPKVHSVFGGLMPVSEVERQARIESRVDPLTGAAALTPVWVNALADGMTPMCAALAQAQSLVEEWVLAHPKCFPPIVINLTDGEANDGQPVDSARRLTGVKSDDGFVLLFNGHLSSVVGGAIEFPGAAADLPADAYARTLFEMSSVIPSAMQNKAQQRGIHIDSGARGMVFNSDFMAVANLLEMGTTMSNA